MPTMAELPMAMPIICAVLFPELGCGAGGCVSVSFPAVPESVVEVGAVAVTVVVTVVVMIDAGLQAVICRCAWIIEGADDEDVVSDTVERASVQDDDIDELDKTA